MKHVVLAFHGHFERDAVRTYAHGDDAPVFVHGVDADDALDYFKRGVLFWITTCLTKDGDLDRAIAEGRAHVKLSTRAGSELVATIERSDDRFEIEVTGIDDRFDIELTSIS